MDNSRQCFPILSSDTIRMVLIERSDWNHPTYQLESLKHRIDSYITFATNGQLATMFPDLIERYDPHGADRTERLESSNVSARIPEASDRQLHHIRDEWTTRDNVSRSYRAIRSAWC